MSDIGFYGLMAALTGFAMLAVAGLGLVLETWGWWRGRGRGRSAARTLFGPAAYALLAAAVLLVTDRGSLDVKEAMDTVAPIVAGVGLVAWVGIRIRGRRDR